MILFAIINVVQATTKYLLLSFVLCIISFQSTPHVNALPRHLIGRNLILPFRHHHHHHHHHHLHQRSAGQEQDPNITYVNRTIALNCPHKSGSTRTMLNPENVQNASVTANATRQSMQEIFEKWITENTSATVENHEDYFKFHKLHLSHALMNEVNSTDYMVSETQATIEEVKKIHDTLSVLMHLIDTINQTLPRIEREEYFDHFRTKIEHNKHAAAVILNIDCSDVPEYSYNMGHMLVRYGLVRECLKVFELIEAKYNIMMEHLKN